MRAYKKGWSAIWQLKVPSKIRLFLWRLARQSIPTGDVLHRRHMTQQAACLICGAEDSWKHSLLECNMAKCVWALSNEEMVEHICRIQDQNPWIWLAEITSSLPREELKRVVVTLWAIWHAKCKAVYEKAFQSPLSTHSFVERYMADQALAEALPEEVQKIPIRSPQWIPPPHGVVKINVDADVSKNSRTASVAAVAKDEAGLFLGALAVVSQGITDPETMKVLAFREGLAHANDLVLHRVRLASECTNAVRSIKQTTRGVYGQIIKEIREDVAEFIHERREANHNAHVLARSTLCSSIGASLVL